jgi:anti-sigma factor RsiW
MTGAKPRDHATHDLDELSEALDGRLAETRHEQVRERLQTCPDCQAAYEAMAWSRAQARGQPAVASPSGLEEGLWDAVAARIKRTTSVRRTLGLGLAAALVAGLATLLARLGSGPAPLPAAAANEFRERAAGRVLLGIETSDASRLEAWFTSASLGFSPRVLDLGMMGYVLQGGAVRELAGRPVAVSVYRETATGRDVLCLMLRGGLAELPAPESTREHSGFRFQVYRREGVTLVFWPEGEVLCALVGGGDPEALVQLAFAKAMVARPAEGG